MEGVRMGRRISEYRLRGEGRKERKKKKTWRKT